MAEVLLWVSLVVLVVVVVVAAYASYRTRQRRAQARSLAALNRLLAEADEIAQAAQRDRDQEPPAP
jgi:cytochrome c-type biogenesis protein CcmH/NrfF